MRLPARVMEQFSLYPSGGELQLVSTADAGRPRSEFFPLQLVPDSERPIPDALSRLRESLAGTAAAHVTNAAELHRRLERTRRSGIVPTTLDAFDTLLGGGLPRGKMVELTGRRAAGRFSIVLSAIASATSAGEAAALIDLGDHLDPQIAEANGADLRRVLWVRPATLKQAVTSAEMVAAAGFQLVVLDAGLYPVRGRRVPDASWVRLGRAAETHGAAMLVSTPYPITATASEAVVAATRARMTWSGRGRSPRLLTGIRVELRLDKHRHRRAGTHATLILSTEVGGWQLAVGGGTAESHSLPPAASSALPALRAGGTAESNLPPSSALCALRSAL